MQEWSHQPQFEDVQKWSPPRPATQQTTEQTKPWEVTNVYPAIEQEVRAHFEGLQQSARPGGPGGQEEWGTPPPEEEWVTPPEDERWSGEYQYTRYRGGRPQDQGVWQPEKKRPQKPWRRPRQGGWGQRRRTGGQGRRTRGQGRAWWRGHTRLAPVEGHRRLYTQGPSRPQGHRRLDTRSRGPRRQPWVPTPAPGPWPEGPGEARRGEPPYRGILRVGDWQSPRMVDSLLGVSLPSLKICAISDIKINYKQIVSHPTQ